MTALRQIVSDLLELSDHIDAEDDDAHCAAVNMAALVSGSLDGDDPLASRDPATYADIFQDSTARRSIYHDKFVGLVKSLSVAQVTLAVRQLVTDAGKGSVDAMRTLYRLHAATEHRYVAHGFVDPPSMSAV